MLELNGPQNYDHTVRQSKFPWVSAWRGGCAISMLESFQDCWIRSNEYHEYGEAIIERKCKN